MLRTNGGVALGLLVVCAVAAWPATGDAAPPARAVAGQSMIFGGTKLACEVKSNLDVLCFRVSKTNKLAPGTHDFRIQPSGHVTVFLADSKGSTSFVYARDLAGARDAPKVLFVLPGQLVKIAGTSTVCASGKLAGRVVVQCAHGIGGTERATVDEAGSVSIVSVKSGKELWTTRAAEMVAQPGQAFAVTVPDGRIVCAVSHLEGNTVVDCAHAQPDGTLDHGSFTMFTQGVVLAYSRQPDGQLKLAGAFGPGTTISKSGDTTSGPPTATTVLGRGSFVRIASSRLACWVEGTPPAFGCGLTDKKGLGPPGSHMAILRPNGQVEVLRFDAQRKPKLLLRTPEQ